MIILVKRSNSIVNALVFLKKDLIFFEDCVLDIFDSTSLSILENSMLNHVVCD